VTREGAHLHRHRRCHKLLLAEGNLDHDDPFLTLTPSEVYLSLTAWVILKTKYASFWQGYETATADATAALQPGEPKTSLLSRLIGWLS
jgi:hypothetical protein